jgi:hypothetical protein
MGAGIVDARALLGADLDLGRDHESVESPDPLTEPEFAVAGLVAEVAGVDAAPDPDLNWHRYGPELAQILLDAQLNAASADGSDAPRESTIPEVSGELAGALGNPRLRDHLGLDDGPVPEVGEVRPS